MKQSDDDTVLTVLSNTEGDLIAGAEAKKYLCYMSDGRLLVAEGQLNNAHVQSYIFRLTRLGKEYQTEMVDVGVIRMTNDSSSGIKIDHTQMQRHAKQLLLRGCKENASDIHIRLREYSTEVYFRIVQHWSLVVLIAIVATVASISFSLPNWRGKARVRFDTIPPYSIYRLLVGSGFLMSLAALVGAGVPVERALIKLADLASPWLRERIYAAVRGIQSGLNLGDALKKSGHRFPSDEIIDDLCVYAEYGGFSVAIKRVADEWLQDGVVSVSVSMKVMNTAAMFFLAAVVMWLVAGFFGIQQEISHMVQGAS